MYEWNISDPASNCWILLVQAYQASRRAVEIELSRHGATIEQFHILMLLAASTVPLSPGEIASYVFREKHSISERLTRMERFGYIKKSKSQDDERMVKVEITAKGRRFLAELMRSATTYARSMVAECLPPEAIDALEGPLKRIRDHALRALGEDSSPLPTVLDASAVEKTVAECVP